MAITVEDKLIKIRQVRNDNLEKEFDFIRRLVDRYPYIAILTKFPGVVLHLLGNFTEHHYQTLKVNVDMLKVIQLGLTLSDKEGNLPTCDTDKFCVWQFNFREFNVSEDVFANDSIELLRQSGIDFKKNNEKGIEAQRFGELLMSSGIVMNDDVRFVTFHGGNDFAYLLKLLMGKNLPDTKTGFLELVNIYFPKFYDIKHLMEFCDVLHGGLDLDELAEILGVQKISYRRQAGSDSRLTFATFKKMKEVFFYGPTEIHAGALYGLSVEN